MKAMDALRQHKDAQYMGELFIKVIEDVGVDSYVQTITGNAHVCKVVGMILEANVHKYFGPLALFIL